MKMLARSIAMGLLLGGSGAAGRAELFFAEPTVEISPVAAARKIEVEFVAENRGARAERIEKIDVECGCTVASFERAPLAPGGKSVIHVSVDLQALQGKALRRLTVFGEHDSRGQELLVRIDAPVVLTPSPASIAWTRSEFASEKIVRLHLPLGGRLSDVQATSRQGKFVSRVVTDPQTGEVCLAISPAKHARGHFTDSLMVTGDIEFEQGTRIAATSVKLNADAPEFLPSAPPARDRAQTAPPQIRQP